MPMDQRSSYTILTYPRIKFLHYKKQRINQKMYKLHLEYANKWKNLWTILDQNTEEGLSQDMETHYAHLNQKLDNLQIQQQKKEGRKNTKNTEYQFYKRTINLTKIQFNKEEMELLNTGMQHSIQKPMEQYWNDLTIETDQAIRKLDTKTQDAFRITATKKLKQMENSDNQKNIYAKCQTHTMKNIKKKLKMGNTITRADKGKTIVIIDTDEYNKKPLDFINKNNFKNLNNNPTGKFQKPIKENLKQCNMIINKKQIKHLTQNKPQAPRHKAQIKLHKQGNPIRPVVNKKNAPAYKLAKYLAKILQEYIQLKYQYNVKNATTLAQDLTHMKINDKHRLITFDIKDLYVNIPTKETLTIAKTMLATRNNKIITQQMIQLLEITLQQNHFIFGNKLYQQEKGISMGSPLSNDIAEIFLQHHEQTLLNQLTDNKTIDYYTRYVDDILIIYNTDTTNTKTICNYLNTIHPSLIFTPTQEENKNINFLDLLTL